MHNVRLVSFQSFYNHCLMQFTPALFTIVPELKYSKIALQCSPQYIHVA